MDEGTVDDTARDLPRGRVDAALRQAGNWEQLVKFCVVGATGYVVNLAVYTALLERRRPPLHPRRDRLVPRRGHEQLRLEPAVDVPRPARPRRLPGAAVPRRLDDRARREPPRPAPARPGRPRRGRRAGARDHARHAGQLRRQQAVVVPPPRLSDQRRVHVLTRAWLRVAAAVAVLALLAAGAAAAATTPSPRSTTRRDVSSRRRSRPTRPVPALREPGGRRASSPHPKVARWLDRYPPRPADRRDVRPRRRGRGRCTSGRATPARWPRASSTTPTGR